MSNLIEQIQQLPLWKGRVHPTPLAGGITNANFVVEDGGSKFFVRAGRDIPVHGVMRFNELAASRAANAAGLSPAVLYQEPGFLVLEFIDGKTFAEEDVRSEQNLERILPLVIACHRQVPGYFRGPALIFWVFQVVRDYAATLRDGNSRMIDELPRLLDCGTALEKAVGKIDLVFGHNDLLPGNFIDDGKRLWLIDFDYAGFNSPLFDLGGLASNNGLNEAQEHWMLEQYFSEPVNESLWISYQAMKSASLLRESMWSMVSELHSTLDFDFQSYTHENLERFERAMKNFQELSK